MSADMRFSLLIGPSAFYCLLTIIQPRRQYAIHGAPATSQCSRISMQKLYYRGHRTPMNCLEELGSILASMLIVLIMMNNEKYLDAV